MIKIQSAVDHQIQRRNTAVLNVTAQINSAACRDRASNSKRTARINVAPQVAHWKGHCGIKEKLLNGTGAQTSSILHTLDTC